jgi:hypothetical protein
MQACLQMAVREQFIKVSLAVLVGIYIEYSREKAKLN